jgi:asparagine synthase (glutamine-hydrolysing)
MCGICGFVGAGDVSDLTAMNAALARRGPDGEGRYQDRPAGVWLAHRRLAILDLAGGGQPMATPDGDLVVTYNGEIYNHAELRRELTALGHVFATSHCDTEVLLHGWRQWGQDLPRRLNGMWAFALYDKIRRQLFLSRDRFGKKPLFFTHRPGLFAFASELTSLAAHTGLSLSVSRSALRKYFAYGFIPTPGSLYEGVRKLPGGANLLLDVATGELRQHHWWSFCLEPTDRVPADAEAQWGERLRELLDAAVARRLMADVPLGVFLSGGVDSSAITALAVRHAPDLRTFSISFDDPSFDESAKARRTAAWCGTRHTDTRLHLPAARALMPDIAAWLDEPMGDASLIPTALLCRETRRHVAVALGGDGADELFAGYAPFKALAAARLYERLVPRPMHLALALLAARLPVGHGYMQASFKINRFLRGLSHPAKLWNPTWLGPLCPAEIAELFHEPVDPEELYSEAIEAYEACPSTHPVDKTMEFYTRLYLQDDILVKTDRAGMMHSLEVRAPFLDIELVDFVRTIPHTYKLRRGVTKYLLKKALEPLLPRDIISRPKQGFAMPVGRWLADGDLPLGPPAPLEAGLDPGFAVARLAEHRQGRADHRLFLWNLWLLRRMACPGGGLDAG